MKLTDEQLRKLLQEQAEMEDQQLSAGDTDAYTLLFESLNSEKAIRAAADLTEITDEVMAGITMLEERKDRRRDAITLVLALCVGLLTTAISYYFIDYPLLQAGLTWLKTHVAVVAFVIIAICIIQFADRKLVVRN